MELDVLSVGTVCDRLHTGQDHYQLSYDGNRWELDIGYPKLRADEIETIQTAPLRIAPALVDDTLFVLWRFGDLPWADTPYEPRLSSTTYPYIKTGCGVTLIIVIADTATGIIKGLRQLTLPNALSNRLHDLCEKQAAKRPLTLLEHITNVQRLYSKYPTSAAMLPLAQRYGDVYRVR